MKFLNLVYVLLMSLTFTCSSTVLAQQLEVIGNAWIRGNLDIHHFLDSTSSFIGYRAGDSTDATITRNNTFVGSFAGLGNETGRENVFFGHLTGMSNRNGSFNTFIGRSAGQDNRIGSYNTCIGVSAGRHLISGNHNSFLGVSAGLLNAEGYANSFFGRSAGRRNKKGNFNVSVGFDSGINMDSAHFNVFLGAFSGYDNASGESNTLVGYWSGRYNNGSWNTFVGRNAGMSNMAGHRNTLIGVNADVAQDGISNATAIGFSAVVDESNKVRIGNQSIQTIEGQVNFSASSDRRHKSNIASIPLGLDWIDQLNPVAYLREDQKEYEMGFIAQEIEEVIQGFDYPLGLIQKNQNGDYLLRYADLLAPVVRSIQELREIIQSQQETIETLQLRLDEVMDKHKGKKNDENK